MVGPIRIAETRRPVSADDPRPIHRLTVMMRFPVAMLVFLAPDAHRRSLRIARQAGEHERSWASHDGKELRVARRDG